MKDSYDPISAEKARIIAVPRPVPKARAKRRHVLLLLSFLVMVVGPIGATAWYLWTRAADQYASRVGFVVRAQEATGSVDLFVGLGSMAPPQSADSDILYEFIQSRDMVDLVQATLDLQARYQKPQNDVIFALKDAPTVEDLLDYWQRMVAVYYDTGTGLIELEVRAFTAEDAVEISEEILRQASILINRLSAIAREDATQYAREELDAAVARLKSARQALTEFRSRNRIVDPSADVQGHMTVLVTLQQQLAATYVELDVLAQTSREDDPRVTNLRREVSVIERRIDLERQKFGLGGDADGTYSAMLGRFEALSVDLEFAEEAYVKALGSFDEAVREAQQKSRYLAAYLNPTRPESAEFPQRTLLLALVALFSFLIWAVLMLVYYSARDRG